jgi:glyoxylase-like metal-dependent hydrolase (beta-lactamase superfamily II)
MVEFDLTDEIRQLGVSKVFATETNIYVYNGKAFAQSAYYKKELQKTLDKLKSQMVYCGHFGDAKAVDKIILLLSRIWVAAEEEKERASNDN